MEKPAEVICACDPSAFRERWEVQTGTFLEAQGPASAVNAAASNKVESEDQSPRLSSDLHMCHSKRASQSHIITHASDSEIT